MNVCTNYRCYVIHLYTLQSPSILSLVGYHTLLYEYDGQFHLLISLRQYRVPDPTSRRFL